MKGVSEVIAIILILMIVIALAALAYTWFSGVFSQMTTTAGTSMTQTTGAMSTAFKVDMAKFEPTGTPTPSVKITIRNIGSQQFNASIGVLGIYIDNTLFTTSFGSPTGGPGCYFGSANGYMLDKGCVVTYVNTTTPTPGLIYCPNGCPGTCTNVTKISLGSGLQDSKNIIC